MDPSINARGHRKRPIGNSDNGAMAHQRKKLKETLNHPLEIASSPMTPAQEYAIEGTDNPAKDGNADNNKPSLTLESLPPELLEKVFIYSLNFSFPHVSPYLAAAISNERVYRLLILLAFWNDTFVGFWFGHLFKFEDVTDDSGVYPLGGSRVFDIPHILRPLGHDYVPLTRAEKGLLQSNVLRSKWFTVDRIRRQIPDLTKLLIAQWHTDVRYIEENQSRELEKVLHAEGIYTFGPITARKVWEKPDERQHRRGRNRTVIGECDITVMTGRLVRIVYRRVEPEPNSVAGTETSHSPAFPILGLTGLPPPLLRADFDHGEFVRGCFTDAHLEMLNILRHSGMPERNRFRSSDIKYTLDALHEGVHVAVTTINPRALDTLLKLDYYFSHRPGLDYPGDYYLPADHFRTAAQTYVDLVNKRKIKDRYKTDAELKKAKDDALLCFCLLLTSSAESVPFDDLVFTQFAKDVGGTFGLWLLDFIRCYPHQRKSLVESRNVSMDIIPFVNYLFMAREPNDFFKLGRTYAEEVMPTSELFEIPIKWKFEDL